MNFLEILKESIGVLKGNKLRTGLSILGIVIGISSVIILMTLGNSSQKSTLDRIASLGSDVITIRPGGSSGNSFFGGSAGRTGSNIKTLVKEDAFAIKNDRRISNINSVTYEYSSNNSAIYEKNSVNVNVSGIAPEYLNIRNLKVEYGREFNENDYTNNEKVAIIGSSTATSLFGNQNPIGEFVRIGSSSFKVIGILESKGSMGSQNLDEIIYLPIETAQRILYGINHLTAIYVKVNESAKIVETQNQIGFLLLEKHNIEKVADADFNVTSSSNLVQTITDITSTFTSLLAGIAAISLIVGGIGIMNIMIVTVNERTREIGIRKALGAKKKEITLQFLIEATILTVIGGIIGILSGILISILITNFLNLPIVISYSSILLSFGVASVTGILFGWYPASVAAKMQPIDALRFE